jgi:hypothetical protein
LADLPFENGLKATDAATIKTGPHPCMLPAARNIFLLDGLLKGTLGFKKRRQSVFFRSNLAGTVRRSNIAGLARLGIELSD